MKYCPNCGKEVNGTFCSNCGRRLDSQVSIVNNNGSSMPYTPQYRPLSPWAYFGYQILFAIPLIGLIFLIAYSVSDNNINLRNYARSYWCALILVLIFFVLGLVIGILGGGLSIFDS